MNVEPHIKQEKKTDGVILMLAAFPAAVAGIVLLLTEGMISPGWIGSGEEARRSFRMDMVSIYVLVMNLGLIVTLYRQKHTYYLRFTDKKRNILMRGYYFILEGIIGPVILYGVMLFPTAFITGAPVLGILLLVNHVETQNLSGQITLLVFHAGETLVLAAAALFTLLAGISALSRSFWISGVKKQLENLATSKAHSAAMGLVEIRGRAFRASQTPEHNARPLLGFSPIYGGPYVAEPFLVEDKTGKVLVDPPQVDDLLNPRFYLNLSEEHGQPVLMEGEEVYVLGALETGEGGEAFIRPWHPPYGMLYKKIRSRLGPLGKRLTFFDAEDLMIVAGGDERAARTKFFRSRYRWFLAGLFFLTGGGTILAVALWAAFGATFL